MTTDTTEETMHTPTPWVIDPAYPSEVQTPDMKTICSAWHEHASGAEMIVEGVLECSLKESAANAALIVRAVNSHAILVDALRSLKEVVELEAWWSDPDDERYEVRCQVEGTLAALALAESSDAEEVEG